MKAHREQNEQTRQAQVDAEAAAKVAEAEREAKAAVVQADDQSLFAEMLRASEAREAAKKAAQDPVDLKKPKT